MKAARRVSRRSFLGSVAGGMAGGGALLLVVGPARALQQRGEPGDSDFIRPVHVGDVFESDRAPGLESGLTDRDSGPGADRAGYGAGGNRQRAQAARCQGSRQRIARYEAMRPRTPDTNERLAALRRYLGGLGCG